MIGGIRNPRTQRKGKEKHLQAEEALGPKGEQTHLPTEFLSPRFEGHQQNKGLKGRQKITGNEKGKRRGTCKSGNPEERTGPEIGTQRVSEEEGAETRHGGEKPRKK